MNRNKNNYRQGNKEEVTRSKRNKKRQRSNNGPKYNDKTKSVEMVKKAEQLDEDSKYNKAAYYIKNPIILEQATQLSFQNFIGGHGIDNYNIPSIMRIHMNPSPGRTWQGATGHYTHATRTGINMAATKLFNRLSMSSGRNMAYAPQDVATTILAMSQLLAMHSYVKRLFQASRCWNNYNRMFPRAIIQAMGIDYDDFVDHYSDYRTRYNALITAVNQLPIFMNCGYLEKSATQYSYIFTDDESPLAQVYVYVPYSTWIVDESSDERGTVLSTTVVVPEGKTTRTFGDLIQKVLQPMVDALITSSTLNLVYADLLNLASKDSSFKFVALDFVIDGEALLPVYNHEALLHIHNMTAMSIPDAPSDGVGYTKNNDVIHDPDNNAIRYQPVFTKKNITNGNVLNHWLVDSPEPSPNAEMRLEMLRYLSLHSNNTVSIGGKDYVTYSVLTDYYVVSFEIIQNGLEDEVHFLNAKDGGTLDDMIASKLSQFDWAPLYLSVDGGVTSGDHSGSIRCVHGDLNFYTEVTEDYINRLAEVIYLGLFDIG